MWIAILIVLIIIIAWLATQKKDAPTADTVPPAQKASASDAAAKALASAEAPKSSTIVSASVSAGASDGTLPAAAVVTATTPADVAKTSSSTPSTPAAPSVPAPIVPAAPVTSTLPKPSSATAAQLATMLPTYNFFPGMTFGGNDISNTGLTDNVPKLAAWCDANASCKGFTTDAWMKSTIIPQDKWYKWSEDPTKGLYVKK